jgi:hypothetical protein
MAAGCFHELLDNAYTHAGGPGNTAALQTSARNMAASQTSDDRTEDAFGGEDARKDGKQQEMRDSQNS